MKAVWLEGEAEALLAFARRYPYPYRLLAEDGGGHALFVYAAGDDLIEEARARGARAFVLKEEGCGKRSSSSR
jgi:hypothetical protein